MRGVSTGALEHLMPLEREHLPVLFWAPGKGVDPVETEDVVDSKCVKDVLHSADALSPPLQIVRSHRLPAINRNAPVLSPFLGKLVVLEVGLRRRAAGPLERELVWSRENVR